MHLTRQEIRRNCGNCDNLTQQDFFEFRGENLFEVSEYFWEYVNDAVRKRYMVYGQPVQSAPGPEFRVYDRFEKKVRTFLNFCSYNYLGYSCNPEVKGAVKEAVDHYGTGAVSAPLLSGYYDRTRELEQRIARFKRQGGAIVFPTGYSANVGILSGLLHPGDIAVLDMLSHASIYDGVRLAGAETRVFAHNSPRSLEKVLKGLPRGRVLVCVEGVYSMDGDLPDLPAMATVCRRYGAGLLVDEAHASLVFGERGAGVAEYFGMEDQVDISIGTFSKSFGAIGGFAAASEKLIAYLRMYARSYVFSCAMAPHTAAGILKVLELFEQDGSPRDRLWDNTRYMHEKLTEAGMDIGNTKSPVVPVMVGNDLRLREIGKRVMERGLYTGVVTYPAVSKKRTRLRLSVSALHTREQMDRCVEILRDVFAGMRDWSPPEGKDNGQD